MFCAPKATVDNLEDDEIVSSFSSFNKLMEGFSKDGRVEPEKIFRDDSSEAVGPETSSEGSSERENYRQLEEGVDREKLREALENGVRMMNLKSDRKSQGKEVLIV